MAPSQREVEDEVRLFFNRFDKNLSGFVDRDEVPLLLKHLGVAQTARHVDEFMAQFEDANEPQNAGKRISFATFRAKVSPPTADLIAERNLAELRSTFNRFDADQNGCITADEVEDLMKFLKVPVQARAQFLAQIDQDGDGLVTFDEFVAVVKPKRV
jgi:Ca2+-binding EF-hand superfamily protein